MLPDLQYHIQQSDQGLATAEQQVATGLRVNQLSDDPAASANMVTSLATSAAVDQYTTNASSVTSLMQSADSAFSAVTTSLNSAITIGTEGANGTETTANRQALATQLQGVLSDVVAQANTDYQGSYIFGGSASSTPPFVAASETYNSVLGTAATPLSTTTALTAGSVTSISDASTGETMKFTAASGDTVATLQAAITSAVSAGTLSAGTNATINAAGQLAISTNNSANGIVVSSNDAALGAMSAASGTAVANSYAYVGNSDVNSVQVGDAMNVTTNVPGNQLFTAGPNVLKSLSDLINALQSQGTTQIGNAATAITTALTYVSQQRVPLDNSLSQVNSQETYLGQEKVTLTTQQNSLVGISLAEAATNLSQAELSNSATLAAAAKALPQTLLDYLK
jgi:flagellar hook-associated protein 3